MDKETITLILAVWGAILSSIAIVWNLYKDIKQRRRLRVSCYIAYIMAPSGKKDNTPYLIWHITNIGIEPVVLTHIGGGRNGKHKKFMLRKTITPLPMTLKPGEYVIESSTNLTLLNDNLKFLSAIDSLNKIYKASHKQVRELKKKYAKGEFTPNKD